MKDFPISILVTEKKILLKMPKNEADLDFVRMLKYSRWDKENFHWEIPNYPGNLEKIKRHFGDRLGEIEEVQQQQSPEPPPIFLPEKNQVYILKEKDQLKLSFHFHEEMIKAVKSFLFIIGIRTKNNGLCRILRSLSRNSGKKLLIWDFS